MNSRTLMAMRGVIVVLKTKVGKKEADNAQELLGKVIGRRGRFKPLRKRSERSRQLGITPKLSLQDTEFDFCHI